MRSPVSALFLAAVLALPLVAGCKSDCRKLAEKLCECTTNSVEKETCTRTVSSRESSLDLSQEDNARCKALLDGCDCRKLDPATPDPADAEVGQAERIAEAKRACGLARRVE